MCFIGIFIAVLYSRRDPFLAYRMAQSVDSVARDKPFGGPTMNATTRIVDMSRGQTGFVVSPMQPYF